MRIAAVRVTPLRLRFAQPLRTARGEFGERAGVLLELRDADGVAGYGEAAPWPGFGTESHLEAQALLESVGATLAGCDLQPGDAGLATRLGEAPAARAAVEGALWDLAARRAGRPLAVELAAGCPAAASPALSRVAVGALLVSRAPAALRDEAASARAAGHRAVKIKLGGTSLDEDLARLAAVRDGVGPEVRIRGDANGAWQVREAIDALAVLAAHELEYVEQPVAADDVAGLAEVRRRAAVRIAADESAASERHLRQVLAMGAADVVVLKPAMLGGAARALQLAAQARRAGLDVVFTHTFESAVGARHVLHCAAAWGDPQAVHGLKTAGLFVADVAAPVECRDGAADVGDAAGLGIAP